MFADERPAMPMEENESNIDETNPLQKVDRLYEELVAHYDEAEDRNLRAAAKLLLVALEKFRQHAGPDWIDLVNEYLALVQKDPQKARRVMRCHRLSKTSPPF